MLKFAEPAEDMKHTPYRRIPVVLIVSLCLSPLLANADTKRSANLNVLRSKRLSQPGAESPSPSEKLRREMALFTLRDLHIEGARFESAVAQLRRAYRRYADSDARHGELPLRIVPARTEAEKRGLAQVPDDFRIDYKAESVSALAATRTLGAMAGYKLAIEKSDLVLRPIPDLGDAPHVRSYRVPPDFRTLVLGDDESAKGPELGPALAKHGIPFPEGMSAFYNPKTSVLIVRNTQRNHELVEGVVSQFIDSIQMQVLLTSGIVRLPRVWLEEDQIMSEKRVRKALREFDTKTGGDLFRAPSVVTRNGKQAKVEIIRELILPTDAKKTVFETYPAGLQIAYEPHLEGGKIRLTGHVALNMLKSQTPEQFLKQLRDTKLPKDLRKADLDPVVTEFDGLLADGQTIALSCLESQTSGGQIIAFLKAELIDPAGQRIR